jgi:L-iditol 2-dehydrogenase
MKAALLTEPRKIKLENIEEPSAKPGEILIEVKSCGVCATDVKKYTGFSKTPFFPFILGHEPAGIIKSLGTSTNNKFMIGGRVAVAPVVTCGVCPGCVSGKTSAEGMGMCDHYEVIGFSINGAFCETVSVPEENVFKIPESLSFAKAALIEPVAACANAVLRSQCTPPGYAVVLGSGFMGLVSMQVFKALGYQVMITDLLEDRLKLATELGADMAINPQESDLKKAVHDFTGGAGADSIICAVGNKPMTETGINLLRKGGRIVLMASGNQEDQIGFNLNALHYSQSVITGSVSYTKQSYQWAINLLDQGKITAEKLITRTGGLDTVGEMLEMTANHVGIKNVMVI